MFNAQQYVREAIQSILDQSFVNFELLIINDGSTDSSESIIKSFSDHRIRYIKNDTNLGLIATLNKGLSLSQGEFVARMDADDVCLKERLAEQLKCFENDPELAVVACDYFVIGNGSKKRARGAVTSDQLKSVLLFSPCFAHPTVMMRNLFEKSRIFYDQNFKHTEDYKLWCDLSRVGKFGNVSMPLMYYRSHPGQVSVQYRDVQIKNCAVIRRDYLQHCGFTLSENDFLVHTRIADNVFIKSLSELEEIEKWLRSLIEQNKNTGHFIQEDFNAVIGKFWLDSCGYTSLGMVAYRAFANSPLSSMQEVSTRDRLKLLTKCLIRKYRHRA